LAGWGRNFNPRVLKPPPHPQGIVMYYGNIINGAHVVAAVFFATVAMWIYGVLGLSTMFEAKVNLAP